VGNKKHYTSLLGKALTVGRNIERGYDNVNLVNEIGPYVVLCCTTAT
jgi:hypothetical protein